MRAFLFRIPGLQFRRTAVTLSLAIGSLLSVFVIPACKSGAERTETIAVPPASRLALEEATPAGDSEDDSGGGHSAISEDDRQALENLEKAIQEIGKDPDRRRPSGPAETQDMLKSLLGDSALRMPDVQDTGSAYRSGSSIPKGSLPFDALKALNYLDQLIAFRLDLKVGNDRIDSVRRVMVQIDASVSRNGRGDFSFDQTIVQTPSHESVPSRATLKAVRTPSANFLKVAEAPWWRYPPNDKVKLERYFDVRLVERVLASVGALGRFQAAQTTYQGRRATRYQVDRRPGEYPPYIAAFNPSNVELGAEIIIDEATGMMLKLDYLLASKYNPGSGDVAETLAVKLAVSDIGSVDEIPSPETFVDGPQLGGDPIRPR